MSDKLVTIINKSSVDIWVIGIDNEEDILLKAKDSMVCIKEKSLSAYFANYEKTEFLSDIMNLVESKIYIKVAYNVKNGWLYGIIPPHNDRFNYVITQRK